MNTDGLMEFIRARLDDDARIARAAREGPWAVRFDSIGVAEVYSVTREAERGGDSNVFPDAWHEGSREHAIRHDPARVLREVEAERLTLDWLEEVERFMDRDDMSWHRLGGEADTDNARRLLALPYSDHEDFKEEWRV